MSTPIDRVHQAMTTLETVDFDAVTRTVATTGTRRGLLRLAAALPLSAGLAGLLAEVSEAGREHRRNAKHRHQTGNNKEHRKGERKGKRKGKRKGQDTGTGLTPCTPTTCAAQGKTCGTIPDGCGGTLECDCGDGQVCQTNQCVACGSPGEPCCSGDYCDRFSNFCSAGTCVSCGQSREPCCWYGCDDGGVCLSGICKIL